MNAETLLENDVNAAASRAAEALANAATYTTTALAALALFHDEAGDEAGAALLRRMAAQFAEHEATTL